MPPLWKTLVTSVPLLLLGCTGIPDGVSPVTSFDAERYLGKWYEIARLDHSFERGLEQVTAEYHWQNNGRISVVNRGYRPTDDSWDEATGKAKFVASTDIGHLKVSFFGPFYSSYVVFELDENYQYAFVSGYSRKYLWLLSRTPTITDAVKRRFLDKVHALEFNTDDLIWVNQQ